MRVWSTFFCQRNQALEGNYLISSPSECFFLPNPELSIEPHRFFPFPFIRLSSILLRSKIMYVSWERFFQGIHHVVSLWERLGIRYPQIKNQISTNQNSELDIDVTCVVGYRPGESRGSHLPLFCSILRPDRPTPPPARSWHTA